MATRFSPLEPKLTTCAGSPAFHAPEIVDALNHPPGVIRYVGPEVDVWCVGLVVLYLLTGDRHPIGSEHRNLDVMQASVQRQLKRVEDELLRETLASFLDLDGDARMEAFRSHIIDPAVAVDIKRRSADLKPISTDEVEDRAISFVPREPRCRLDPVEGGLSDLRVLRFHLDDTPRETLADVKHMLRSAVSHGAPLDVAPIDVLFAGHLVSRSDGPRQPRLPTPMRFDTLFRLSIHSTSTRIRSILSLDPPWRPTTIVLRASQFEAREKPPLHSILACCQLFG